MPTLTHRESVRRIWVVVATGAMVTVLLAILAGVAALTFSVRVQGSSMEPTLHSGDRLLVDLLHRHDIRRFDLVEAIEPDLSGKAHSGGAYIVKRVIGMPGDRIAIIGGTAPVVLLRPAGQGTAYRVVNPTWTGRIGADVGSCCSSQGYTLPSGVPRQWVTVPAASYWVIGDNWGGSTDSRAFGWIPASSLKAKLALRLLPLGSAGWLRTGATLVADPTVG